jgi:hypothetical protein
MVHLEPFFSHIYLQGTPILTNFLFLLVLILPDPIRKLQTAAHQRPHYSSEGVPEKGEFI